MTVSLYGVRGGRSLSQSKNGLMTTDFIIREAESAVFMLSGSPKL